MNNIIKKTGMIIAMTTTLAMIAPFVALADNPVPAITSISPTAAMQGSADIALTVNGNDFLNTSVVYFNGIARPTAFNSSGQLTANVPAAALLTGGAYSVTVLNASPGGGFSNTFTFFVNPVNPVGAPVISGISPAATVMGSGVFTLTVSGSGFDSNSFVRFNGIARATTYVSPFMLTATILPSDVAVAQNQAVMVVDPERGSSNTVLFAVNAVPGLPNTGYGPNNSRPINSAEYGLLALAAVTLLGVIALRLSKKTH